MKLILVVLGALLAASPAVSPQAPRPAPAAPVVEVVDLKGLDAALARYRGQAMLVNFWAIWCEPCVAEMPELLAVGREFAGKGGIVVTVSYDLMLPGVTNESVLKQMRAFAASHGIDAPVYIYDGPDYDDINARFGLPGPVPSTIAVDKAGTIVDRHAGKGDASEFRGMMRKALGVVPPAP